VTGKPMPLEHAILRAVRRRPHRWRGWAAGLAGRARRAGRQAGARRTFLLALRAGRGRDIRRQPSFPTPPVAPTRERTVRETRFVVTTARPTAVTIRLASPPVSWPSVARTGAPAAPPHVTLGSVTVRRAAAAAINRAAGPATRPGPDGAGRTSRETGTVRHRQPARRRRVESAGRPATAVVRGAPQGTADRVPPSGALVPALVAPAPAVDTTPENQRAADADVDLDRLTDQIVSRLDDRLTAHRERFGRSW
jgi:hypothetical protein